MRMKSIHLRNYKRFTDTRIDQLPQSARLIVLAGPNGSGKSSVFDGIKTWHGAHGAVSSNWDETYGTKQGGPSMSWPDHVQVDFHEPIPQGPNEQKKLVYVRTAFRNEAEFQLSGFSRMASPLDTPRISRMIDADATVSENFQRLISATIDGLWGSELPDETSKYELRERIIGRVRDAMNKVFPDLVLVGVGGLDSKSDNVGTFYFSKGASQNFLYKNLSAGEKAAFDLLLDAVIKREHFDNSIWCIDEPETHLNTRIQATLLKTILELLPANSQLVLASHSIGFMRGAWEMAKAVPGSVAFVDMHGHDFDSPIVILPVPPSREFWAKTLEVALGDLASLMAPETIVLCEGRPSKAVSDRRGSFDASCYRIIFASKYSEADFLSVGNSNDVRDNRLEAGHAIQTLASGTKIIRVIDRDLRSQREVEDETARGYRVLSRRNIESYLLDDEILSALCITRDQPERVSDALALKKSAVLSSVTRGNDPDDLKSAAGQIATDLRRLLMLTGAGSDWNAFARDSLAPLFRPEMSVYRQLESDIFGDRP